MKRSWLDKHWPVILYIVVVLVSLFIVFILGYRIGIEKGELIQYNADVEYIDELNQALKEEKEEIHTCPYCNKIFSDWK